MFILIKVRNNSITVIFTNYKIERGNGMDTLSLVLVIIGALNWGLISLFQFDLVATIFGGQDALFSRIIYGLVGLAGLYCIKFLMERDKNRPVIKE